MVEFMGQVMLFQTIIMGLSSTLQKVFSVKNPLASIAGSAEAAAPSEMAMTDVDHRRS